MPCIVGILDVASFAYTPNWQQAFALPSGFRRLAECGGGNCAQLRSGSGIPSEPPNGIHNLDHSVRLGFDSATAIISSNSADIVEYLSRHIVSFYPDDAGPRAQERECRIEIYLLDRQRDRRIILCTEEGAASGPAMRLLAPDAVLRSDGLIRMRWGTVEGLWRPFDLLASLNLSPPATVRLLVARPMARSDEPATREGALRAKVAVPGDRAIPRDEIADLVRAMLVRAQGHLCLHAAAVAWGYRGALLLGPSGSGKTTTALALLRGGFRLLSDEHSVLHGAPGRVRITGFRGAPRLVGGGRRGLVDLERTLGACTNTKAALHLPHDPKSTGWVEPAALFFLRVRPGPAQHAVNRLPVEEAFIRTTAQVLDPTGLARLDTQAQAIIRLVEACPSYELCLGVDLASLPGIIRETMEAAK